MHCTQLCCLYFKLCEEFVCSLCTAKTHNKYNKTEVSEKEEIKSKEICQDLELKSEPIALVLKSNNTNVQGGN